MVSNRSTDVRERERERESTRSMRTEVKTKRDATGARDPKSAKRHGVARELK